VAGDDAVSGRRRHRLIGGIGLTVCVAGVAGMLLGYLRPGAEPEPRPRSGGSVIGAPTPGAGSRTPGTRGRTWYVSARAAPAAKGSRARPFSTLQAALDAAWPGDTVIVAAGTYPGEFRSVRSGERGAPITIEGRDGAVLKGKGAGVGRVLTIRHDWLVVDGLTVTDGGKGIWLEGARHVTIRKNVVSGIGGECVRLKYFAVRNEVSGNRIGPCGLVAFDLRAGNKNGEGVYVGTAPEQLSRNPTQEPDASGGNWVHDNVISVPAECVDVKESAERNLVERNTCTGGRDPEGAGLGSRGNRNVFRYNRVTDVVGKGVRLGGDTPSQGIHNEVYGNVLLRTEGHAVGAMRLPQARICGNTVGRNGAGVSNTRSVTPATPCR
jgi:hypothetical protein